MKKTISCGFIIINNNGDILICHPTNNKFWDFPKGKLENNETHLDCAYRETFEETSLDLKLYNHEVVDICLAPYNKKKDLHLFVVLLKDVLDVKKLKCNMFIDITRKNKTITIPEMDKFSVGKRSEVYEKLSPSMKKWLDINYPFV